MPRFKDRKNQKIGVRTQWIFGDRVKTMGHISEGRIGFLLDPKYFDADRKSKGLDLTSGVFLTS